MKKVISQTSKDQQLIMVLIYNIDLHIAYCEIAH